MLNTGLSPNTVKAGLDEVFFTEYDYQEAPGIVTAENALFFKQKSTEMGAVQIEEFMPPGEWESHLEEEEVKQATVRTGNKITFSVVSYKKSLPISIEYIEDDQHEVVDNAVRMMGVRARTSKDKNALLGTYGNGFGSTLTADGQSLFSNSHVALNGDTIDNLETGSLGPANLETLVRVLMIQKAQDGEAGSHQPAGLLVPPILFPDAIEITASTLKPGTANNELNYFSDIYPGLVVGQAIWLDATYNSATNANTSHYLVSRNHTVSRWVRKEVTTEFIPWEYDSKDRAFYKGRYREVVGAISWEGIVGSNGTV